MSVVKIRFAEAKDRHGKKVERPYPQTKSLWLSYNIRNKLAPKCKCGSDTYYFNVGRGGDGYYCLTSLMNHILCDEIILTNNKESE